MTGEDEPVKFRTLANSTNLRIALETVEIKYFDVGFANVLALLQSRRCPPWRDWSHPELVDFLAIDGHNPFRRNPHVLKYTDDFILVLQRAITAVGSLD